MGGRDSGVGGQADRPVGSEADVADGCPGEGCGCRTGLGDRGDFISACIASDLVGCAIRVELDAPGIFNAMGGNITGSDVVHAITFAQNPDDVLLDGFRRVTGVIVRIHYGGEMGSVEYRVPMNGAVDAMMFMDIAQERVGRVDALVARGPFPSDDPSDPYPYLNDEEEGEPELAQSDDGAADEHMEDGPNGSYIDLLVGPGADARLPDVRLPRFSGHDRQSRRAC